MSDDLVKRLRAMCSCNIDETPCLAEEECFVAQEAAKRIEELEAKLVMVESLMDAGFAEYERRLAKAVDALEPFARAAETWEPDDGDSGLGARIEHPHHGLERHAEFTFGDLRRARAALAAFKGGADG